jgi:hypothetical protein
MLPASLLKPFAGHGNRALQQGSHASLHRRIRKLHLLLSPELLLIDLMDRDLFSGLAR